MRLIDIDTTYPLLKERITWLGQYGDDVYRLACECIRGVMETQPTAHDVDKIIKQLERRSVLSRPVGWTKSYEIVTLKDAIEIVKDGGVEK